MRVLVTGAGGWIGSALVPQLLAAGHEVVGTARSDASAARVEASGATVLRATLADLDALGEAAREADGVVHLAFIHDDFSDMAAATTADQRAVERFGDALEGTGKPLVIASGVAGMRSDRVITEQDLPDATGNARAATALAALALAGRGVRSSVVRLAPTVHGAGDHGFLAAYVAIARERGVAGYLGDGTNHWPAVHVGDAAALFRRAAEDAPAGSLWNGTAEEGVPVRTIAEVVGRQLGLPVASVPAERAGEHFGWLGFFLAMDVRSSSTRTQEALGWTPTGPTLLEDLEAGRYTTSPAAS